MLLSEKDLSIIDLMIEVKSAFAQPIQDRARAYSLMAQFEERTKDLSQDHINKLSMRARIKSWQQQSA